MKVRRILHVFRTPVGGLFRHVLDVSRGQAERGHAVGLLCDSSTGGDRAEAALEALRPQLALGITRVPMKRVPHPMDASAILRLNNLVSRERPDVLHGHGSKGGVYARLAGWPSAGPALRVYTPHGGSFHYGKGSVAGALYLAVEKGLEARTDVFLFESDHVRNRFESVVGRTDKVVRVVRNGLHEAEFVPIEREADPFDLVFVGELRTLKGIDTLIDAVALIRRENAMRLTLLCVGAGSEDGALQERARAAGIWDSVAFVPPAPIRSVLARGRIMVVPSRQESLPYVVLEAAAARQPLIATDVGGIGEIFGPFANRLIPPADPAALATRIREMVGQTEVVREAEAEALRDFVRSGFSIDGMVERGIEAYEAGFASQGRP